MKSSVGKNIGIVLLFLVDIIVTSFCTAWMWNNIVARLFQTSEITLVQGWALTCAIRYFIKGRSDRKVDDYFMFFIDDLFYTLMFWLISFAVTIFAF